MLCLLYSFILISLAIASYSDNNNDIFRSLSILNESLTEWNNHKLRLIDQLDFETAQSKKFRKALSTLLCSSQTSLIELGNGGYCLMRHPQWQDVEFNAGNYLADGHFVADVGAGQAMSSLFPPSARILDVGAGQGQYKHLFSTIRGDLHWDSVDGALNIEEYTQGYVSYFDVCGPWPYSWDRGYDWVVSIELGEHIPTNCEDNFLAMLTSIARDGVVLSWSDEYSLPHHPNPRTNEYVKQKMSALGFVSDEDMETHVRSSVVHLGWLKKTMMIFKRRLVVT